MGSFVAGVACGFAIAAPVGAIGVLCLRRTIADGFATGFSCGLGAACADGAYAALASLAFQFATMLIARLTLPLHIAGGIALVIIGLRAAFAKRQPSSTLPVTSFSATSSQDAAVTSPDLWRAFASTFALTIVNPSTFVSFAAVVAASGLHAATRADAYALVVGVVIGSTLWWLLLCGGAAALRRFISARVVRAIDVVSGAGLCAWGVWALTLR